MKHKCFRPMGLDPFLVIAFVVVLIAVLGVVHGQSLVVANQTDKTRRVAVVSTLPFAPGELRAGEGLVHAGQQVQWQRWALPYADGSERIVRVVTDATLPPGRSTLSITRGRGAAAPAIPTHVLGALVDLQFAFESRAGTFVAWRLLDGFEVVSAGPRELVVRQFRRVVDTQWWVELTIAYAAGQAYATLWLQFGLCDPRVDQDGEDRRALTAAESEVAFYCAAPAAYASGTGIELRPLYREHSTRSVEWQAGQRRWRWVLDRHTTGPGGMVNGFIPWGAWAMGKAVLCFARADDDQLTRDSRAAWGQRFAWPQAIATTWLSSAQAPGAWPALAPRWKKHQHWDGRDAAWISQRLAVDAVSYYDSWSSAPGGSLWHAANGQMSQVWHSTDGASPGNHASWGTQTPHYAAQAYGAPEVLHYLERGYYATGCWPTAYREVDGRIVTSWEHPELLIDRGAPGLRSGRGDLLGKSTLQRWRGAGANNFAIRDERTGAVCVAADMAHGETPGVYVHAAVTGDLGARRIAEHHALTTWAGSWPVRPDTLGATGQARGFARGGANMGAWAVWLLGGEHPQLLDRAAELLSHYHDPAMAREDARFPGRLVRSASLFEAAPTAPHTRVELRHHRYFRPWEDALGVFGYAGLGQLLEDAGRPTVAARWRKLAADTVRDTLVYGNPCIVDPVTLRVTYRHSPHFLGSAIALGGENGTRQLTASEMAQSNFALCGGNGECLLTNDGFTRLASGATTFCWSAMWWALSGQDLLLHRYVPEGLGEFDARDARPNDYRPLTWLLQSQRYGGIGHQDRLTLGAAVASAPVLLVPAPEAAWSDSAIVDLPQVVGAAIDLEGRLLALLGPGGELHVYGRAPLGAWGVPRVRRVVPGAVRVGFTVHVRSSDAQRLVVVDGAGKWWVLEI